VPSPRGRKIQIGAALSTVATAAGLFFLFFPHLKPGSGDCSSKVDVTFGPVEVEGGAQWRDYLRETGQLPTAYSDRALAIPGAILNYRATIDGLKGHTVSIEWSLFDAKTAALLGDRRYVDQGAHQVTPGDCSDPAAQPIWIPGSRLRTPVFARVYVYLGTVRIGRSSRSGTFSLAS
jgi:hypothetical protein